MPVVSVVENLVVAGILFSVVYINLPLFIRSPNEMWVVMFQE